MIQNRIYSYFERNEQLHVLFVFDQMNVIGSELEDVTWKEDYVKFGDVLANIKQKKEKS